MVSSSIRLLDRLCLPMIGECERGRVVKEWWCMGSFRDGKRGEGNWLSETVGDAGNCDGGD